MKIIFALILAATTQQPVLAEAESTGIHYQEQPNSHIITVTDTDGTQYVIDTEHNIQYIIYTNGKRIERKL